ncbi:MAG: hypothetical protein ABIY51_15275 [Ferruginibacter sp.]
MEFEEMKKIWNNQENEFYFGINEAALHKRIQVKRKTGLHISNTTELMLIIVNFCTGIFMLSIHSTKPSANTFVYLLSGWMFVIALFVLISRLRRLKRELRFDRSMLGDLEHALAVASYQVRLSQLMQWSVVPAGILIIALMWNAGKSPWITVAVLVFLIVTTFAGRWEHNIYKNRKRQLEILQKKLVSKG